MEENRRVNVQSIREMFERCNNSSRNSSSRNSSTSSNNSNNSFNSCNNNGAIGSSRNGSPVEYDSGGFMLHNRINIKRSPAFRTGPKSLDLTEKRKPKAMEAPCKLVSNKSELCKLEICKSDCWRLEEALKAPLPTGPAPKKPPRTFLHNSCSSSNQLDSTGTSAAGSAATPEPGSTGSTGSSRSSPQRPARKKFTRTVDKPSVVANGPFILTRSKTESSLMGRGGHCGGSGRGGGGSGVRSGSRSDPADEAVREGPVRWLNPVQWNSYSSSNRFEDEDRRSGGLSKSLWYLADPPPSSLPAMPSAPPAIRRSRIPLSSKQQPPLKDSNVKCNQQVRSNWNTRSKSGEMLTKRCSYPQAQRGGGGGGGGGGVDRSLSKTQPSLDKHFYDEPAKEGGLHYMCSPIIQVADINNWNMDRTDESDADSEIVDLRSTQLVEDRKTYVRRVSSNVCDLRRDRPAVSGSSSSDPCSGLFETLLVGALYFDRQTQKHTPYIKCFYPKQSSVPSGVEHFCFPDLNQWPPPLAMAAEPYTIVLTDANGERMYGYCRRIVPEGAQTCIPITYCLISRHRAAGFYAKV